MNQVKPISYVSIQLSDKAGKIIVLKVSGQQISCKIRRITNNKTFIV